MIAICASATLQPLLKITLNGARHKTQCAQSPATNQFLKLLVDGLMLNNIAKQRGGGG